MPSRAAPPRILIIRLSHLGDVVHALPVHHALRESNPDAEIGWAIQPEFAGLIEGLPGLLRTIPFDRRGGAGAWPRLRRELAQFGAGWAIDAQGNLKSAAVTLLSGARRRTGLHPREWREPIGALVCNDRARPTPVAPPVHAVERNLHLARHVGGLAEDWVPSDWLPVTAEERRAAERAWSERFGAARGAPVLVQVAAPGDPRAWPIEHQRELLSRLAGRGLAPLALSGPGEAEPGARLERELSADRRILHWVDQRGLRELIAFLTVAAERGARMVCCDSGPMHLAVACGLPVIALSGPQDPERTGPWRGGPDGERHRVLRARPVVECAPCFLRACALPEGAVCMSRIEPEAVVEALSGG